MSNKTNKQKKTDKFTILLFIELAAAALETLLTIHFSADISILAFPIALIFTGITIYFAIFKMLKNQDGTKCFLVLKLIQYMPFLHLLTFILRRAGKKGTYFAYDLITVILWFVIFFASFAVARELSDKKVGATTKGWKTPKEKYNKPKGSFRVLYETADWIDALVQAVFIVLIFQIFVIQLYEIPSESMVPTFLVKDRVLVTKVDCGPRFPLTDVGIPDMRTYKRGDTVVLRNPHYKIDRKSEVKSVTSQLIYMLTFMTVNTNKDENGEIKYDPLVKRICGEPGEQLVMQDGVLYARTKKAPEFTPVALDAKYATWNLNAVRADLKGRIRSFPLSPSDYENMLNFEEERKNYDLNVAKFQAEETVRKFNAIANRYSKEVAFTKPNLFENSLFSNSEALAKNMLLQKGGQEFFQDFMTSWIKYKDLDRDMYAEAAYRLNVMSKITFGNLVLRYAELISNGTETSTWAKDPVLLENLNRATTLDWYIQNLQDQRNMPVFPASQKDQPEYLPNNCYFMMGDNRFNSLDLRHDSDYSLKPVCQDDPLAIQYYSIIAPQYINKKYIIGKPTFRFWPKNRLGRVR